MGICPPITDTSTTVAGKVKVMAAF